MKFSMLSVYAPSLVSNPRDEMSYFVMGVADLMREECPTAMPYDDITLARIMVYAHSIQESRLRKMARNFKTGCSSDKE